MPNPVRAAVGAFGSGSGAAPQLEGKARCGHFAHYAIAMVAPVVFARVGVGFWGGGGWGVSMIFGRCCPSSLKSTKLADV